MLNKKNFKSQSKKLVLVILVASACNAHMAAHGQIIENRDVPAIEFGHVHKPYDSDHNATNIAPPNFQTATKITTTQPITAPLQIPLRATPALNLASPVETPETLTKPATQMTNNINLATPETSASTNLSSAQSPTTETTPSTNSNNSTASSPAFVPWGDKRTSTLNTTPPGYTPPDGTASETTTAPTRY